MSCYSCSKQDDGDIKAHSDINDGDDDDEW